LVLAMHVIGFLPALSLSLCFAGLVHARPAPPQARAAAAAPAAEHAPGSLGAAEQDAVLRGMLERLPDSERAHFAAMSLATLDEIMRKPEAGRSAYEQDTAAAIADAATVELYARWDEVMASALAAASPEDRALLAATPVSRIAELADRPSAEYTAEDRRVADALDRSYAAHAMSEIPTSHGDVTVNGSLAVLHLGEDFDFIHSTGATQILVEHWGNPKPAVPPLGMIVPRGRNPLAPDGWAVLVTYSDEGHVEDDDAEDIDYEELLEEMRSDDAERNAERRRLGLHELELVGWAATPHYDAEHHRLYWARELLVPASGAKVLNYDVRVLARSGVLSLNAVGSMDQLDEVGDTMGRLLGAVELQPGGRYQDFVPSLDRVAAYGIGGLIAGKLAMKAGILAGLLSFAIAAKKAIVLGAIACFAAIGSWLKRRRGD
jgi:uncharacterized membrane-anchored protein